jgi:hypothetical protein
MAILSYRELHVWQKSMDFVVECYRVAEVLQIAARLRYTDESLLDRFLLLSNESGRMLNGLMQSLQRRLTTDH